MRSAGKTTIVSVITTKRAQGNNKLPGLPLNAFFFHPTVPLYRIKMETVKFQVVFLKIFERFTKGNSTPVQEKHWQSLRCGVSEGDSSF
jgi:hypothetical protein